MDTFRQKIFYYILSYYISVYITYSPSPLIFVHITQFWKASEQQKFGLGKLENIFKTYYGAHKNTKQFASKVICKIDWKKNYKLCIVCMAINPSKTYWVVLGLATCWFASSRWRTMKYGQKTRPIARFERTVLKIHSNNGQALRNRAGSAPSYLLRVWAVSLQQLNIIESFKEALWNVLLIRSESSAGKSLTHAMKKPKIAVCKI